MPRQATTAGLVLLALTSCSYGTVYQTAPNGTVHATQLVRHCAVPIDTPYGPDRLLCPMPQLLPLGAACYCAPPPGPPSPPLSGRTVR